jgi:hypothetical protein
VGLPDEKKTKEEVEKLPWLRDHRAATTMARTRRMMMVFKEMNL